MTLDTPAPEAESTARFRRFWLNTRRLLISLLFVLGTTLTLIFPLLDQSRPYDLSPGEVAPEDIHAPRDISYVSQIEMEEAREEAVAAVDDVFDPADARIGRTQVRRAQGIINFMRDVRADPYATPGLKISYLQAITALDLMPESAETILAAGDGQFDLLAREMLALIEETMSGTVEEGHLDEAISRLELKISADMPEALIPVTLTLARGLIVPNSVLNVSATEQARQEALEAVPEIRHTFREGEVVLRAGERVDELDLEALQVLGLAAQRVSWRDVASALLYSLLAGVLVAAYFTPFSQAWGDDPGRLLLVVVLFLAFTVAAQFMVPSQPLVAYLFPAAALTMALRSLIGVEFAVLGAVIIAMLVGYIAGAEMELATYTLISSLLAAASLRRTTRLNAYFLAGLAAALGGLAVLLVFHLPRVVDPARLAQLLSLAAINGLISAGLSLVILFVVGNLTGLTTSLRLLDLMRPDHPLQRRLQQEALGTYQHTLSVANLVEAAAEAIGADSLLARVGTLYHDIGKMTNPGFYVENRTEGSSDPHSGLSPLASARLIKQHVADGADMARRYRLPPRVAAFVTEHHGTMPILYFLHKAREEAAEAGVTFDERPFYYDGPPPQSPETAILMLADGAESATRANRPATTEELEELVTRIIQQRLDAGQMDDSDLTLTDIKQIRESFVRTLKGMYHPRVLYPGDAQRQVEAGRAEPLPAAAATDVAMPPALLPGVDDAAEQPGAAASDLLPALDAEPDAVATQEGERVSQDEDAKASDPTGEGNPEPDAPEDDSV